MSIKKMLLVIAMVATAVTNIMAELKISNANIITLTASLNVEDAPETIYFSSQEVSQEAPAVVALFMIKNEEHVIKETLQPYVDGGIEHFFIFDTGSTDATIAITQAFFEERNITHYFIAQEPFVDFATSRNRGLALAREKFPNSAFLLMPDAEWYIHNVPGLMAFCEEKRNDYSNFSYLMRITNAHIDFYTPRVIRTFGPAHFEGVVHEIIMPAQDSRLPKDVYFELGSTTLGVEKSRARWLRDLVLLRKEFEAHPQDSRTAFYLAQTYDALTDAENAYKYYGIRSKMAGWDEENFMAVYRQAQAAHTLHNQNVAGFEWPLVLDLYLKAYTMRPTRIEPLVKIGEYYWQHENQALAFFFGRRAVEMPYPENDHLFVEKNTYNFQRFELLSKSAWYVGECRLGERATRHLLETYKDIPQFYRNLVLYLECDKKPSDLWGNDPVERRA